MVPSIGKKRDLGTTNGENCKYGAKNWKKAGSRHHK